MHAFGRLSASLWLAVAAASASADGLQPPDSSVLWPQWQARRTVSMQPLSTGSLLSAIEYGPSREAREWRDQPQTTMLLGDYFFRVPGLDLLSRYGSLRATTGLMINQRGPGLQGLGLHDPQREQGSALPYLGLGYSGLSLKGGWNFDADIGVVAGNPSGAWRFGRALLGNQGSDGTLRDLRLSPVLQLGMRYSF